MGEGAKTEYTAISLSEISEIAVRKPDPEARAVNLPPLIESFVLHFGEMGSRWGVNRTVGQIYALLYVAPQPLCADEIVEALGISRSNVSMSLRELQAWNLVVLKHRADDRRDFFTTPDDVWQILRTLAEERKKREVDPTLSVLRELLMQPVENAAEQHAQARMQEMHALIEQLTTWYDDVKRLETERLAELLSLGSRITRLLEARDRIVSFGRARRPARARPGAGSTVLDEGR